MSFYAGEDPCDIITFTAKSGVGKMCLVCLSVSASSIICNSYQIKHLTFVYTRSLPLTLLISFFPLLKTEQYLP